MPHTEPQVRWMVPLSRKISAVIFLCIFAAEAILLCFSYFSERDRLIAQVDRSIEVLMPSLSPIYFTSQSAGDVSSMFRTVDAMKREIRPAFSVWVLVRAIFTKATPGMPIITIITLYWFH